SRATARTALLCSRAAEEVRCRKLKLTRWNLCKFLARPQLCSKHCALGIHPPGSIPGKDPRRLKGAAHPNGISAPVPPRRLHWGTFTHWNIHLHLADKHI
ncbi:unnamed protein product, partial [Cylicocyclus nassatus]